MNTILITIRDLVNRFAKRLSTQSAEARVSSLIASFDADAKKALERSEALLSLAAEVSVVAQNNRDYSRRISRLAGALEDTIKA